MRRRYVTLGKYVTITTALLLAVVITLDPVVRNFVLFRPEAVSAVGGHIAVDEIGQTNAFPDGDPSQSVADFEQVGVNDGPVNAYSLNAPKGIAVAMSSEGSDPNPGIAYVADSGNNRVVGYPLAQSCGDGCSNPVFGSALGYSYHYAVTVLGQPGYRTSDPGTSETQLHTPTDILNASGYLFVTDTDNNRVLGYSLDSNGLFPDDASADIVIGQPDFTSSSAATSATGMSGPTYLLETSYFDPDTSEFEDALFVADTGNNRVLVFNVATLANGAAANHVLGQADLVSGSANRGGAADANTLSAPLGLAYENYYGYLYVADNLNNRVLVYDIRTDDGPGGMPDDGIVNGEDAVVVLGQDDFVTTAPGFDASHFSSPTAVTAGYNRIFVGSETDNRMLVFTIPSLFNGKPAASQLGQSDLTGSDQCGTDDDAPCSSSLNYVGGIENTDFHGNDVTDVLVSDTTHNRVLQFYNSSTADGVIGQFNGNIDTDEDLFNSVSDISAWGLNNPSYVAYMGGAGGLLVSDTDNNRLNTYRLTSGDLETRGMDDTLGQGDSDNSQFGVQTYAWEGVFQYEGTFRSSVPNWANENIDSAGTAADYNMTAPSGVAFNSNANQVFLFDSGNNRLLRYDDGGSTYPIVGQHAAAQHATDVGGTPIGIAYDTNNGRLFVPHGESGDSVTAYDSDFNVLDRVTGLVGTPNSVAYDTINDRLFVQSSNCVFVFDGAATLEGQTPAGVLGDTSTDCTNSGSDAHSMQDPDGLAVDDTGSRLFVADQSNNRVLVFNITEITSGEDAVDVYGQNDLTSNDAGTGQSSLSDPRSVAFIPTNNTIAVGDQGNNRVMIFSAEAQPNAHVATDVVGHVDGGGSPIFTNGAPNNDAGFLNIQGMETPDNVALDAVHHRLFVADEVNNRVLVFNLDVQNQPEDHDADFVIGQLDFSTGAPGLSATALNTPVGVSYDGCSAEDCGSAHDRLFVGDAGNSRVLVYDFNENPLANGVAATGVFGQTNFDSGDCNRSGAPDETTLCNPAGVSVEPLNDVLAVADTGNNRVIMYALSGTFGNGITSAILGQDNYVDNEPNRGGSAAAETLDTPVAVLVETNSNSIWVADYNNNRVLRYNLFDVMFVCGEICGGQATSVLGQADFFTTDSRTSRSGMSNPAALALIQSDDIDRRLFVADQSNNRVLVYDITDGALSDGIDGADAVDAYGQLTYDAAECGTSDTSFCDGTGGVDYDETSGTLYVSDQGNNRVLIFGPSPTPTPTPPVSHGGSGFGFFPERITINSNDPEVEGHNVLVDIWAHFSTNFVGTVDVLLSNTPDFNTTIPFRYNIPDMTARKNWPKTVAWDLCFGVPQSDCADLGRKWVYARFYVNLPTAQPALTPINQGP